MFSLHFLYTHFTAYSLFFPTHFISLAFYPILGISFVPSINYDSAIENYVVFCSYDERLIFLLFYTHAHTFTLLKFYSILLFMYVSCLNDERFSTYIFDSASSFMRKKLLATF